ncbi:MAG: non-canonical purine NTP pyrophosphatase, partial [Tepidanaerobacter acetatoxydans]|uniref:non-canonical purine NTP pyrophosphatase n=1 Tax=Tepidanaerobacter acetatoxydans TaxID=499229 RepID=UPI0026EF03FB
MGTLVIATKNKGKYLELKKMLGDISFTLLSLEAFPHIEIKETGTSFDENALIKARVTAKETGLPALADDSG